MKQKIFFTILSIIVILGVTVKVQANEIDTTPSGIPISEVNDYIDNYMSKYIGKSSPGAAVVVVKDSKIIFSKGYGYADINKEIKVDPANTIFEYGSVSKLFVYTTIMQLVEKGKLNLNEDIRTYLPKNFLKKLRYNEPITLLNVMNHTTGFEDYLFDVILISTKHMSSLEQALLNCQPVQVYKPGTVVSYSNYAVALAAYIAEQKIGKTYYKYLMDTIFLPLGMDNTSAHPTLKDKPNITENKAQGYVVNTNGGFTLKNWSYIPLYPVGSINGTAEDLAYFAIALMPQADKTSPLFNKESTLNVMLSQTYEVAGKTGFAHGFIEYDGQYKGVGHGGNTAYFSSQFNIVPDQHFGVIILTNTASEMDITSGLTNLLIGKSNNDVAISKDSLPDASEVTGYYAAARRMHSSFLELVGYMNLLKIEKMDENKIKLSMMGQSSILLQTEPHIYKKIDAKGSIFKYHFDTVKFEVKNGKVLKMSGDYLPLSKGRSISSLIVSIIVVIICSIFFVLTPFILLIKNLIKPHNVRNKIKIINTILMLNGTILILNNAILVGRMLVQNYRSFVEMKIHIILNYPLAITSGILIFLLIKETIAKKGEKTSNILIYITIILSILLIAFLINWKFFNILY